MQKLALYNSSAHNAVITIPQNSTGGYVELRQEGTKPTLSTLFRRAQKERPCLVSTPDNGRKFELVVYFYGSEEELVFGIDPAISTCGAAIIYNIQEIGLEIGTSKIECESVSTLEQLYEKTKKDTASLNKITDVCAIPNKSTGKDSFVAGPYFDPQSHSETALSATVVLTKVEQAKFEQAKEDDKRKFSQDGSGEVFGYPTIKLKLPGGLMKRGLMVVHRPFNPLTNLNTANTVHLKELVSKSASTSKGLNDSSSVFFGSANEEVQEIPIEISVIQIEDTLEISFPNVGLRDQFGVISTNDYWFKIPYSEGRYFEEHRAFLVTYHSKPSSENVSRNFPFCDHDAVRECAEHLGSNEKTKSSQSQNDSILAKIQKQVVKAAKDARHNTNHFGQNRTQILEHAFGRYPGVIQSSLCVSTPAEISFPRGEENRTMQHHTLSVVAKNANNDITENDLTYLQNLNIDQQVFLLRAALQGFLNLKIVAEARLEIKDHPAKLTTMQEHLKDPLFPGWIEITGESRVLSILTTSSKASDIRADLRGLTTQLTNALEAISDLDDTTPERRSVSDIVSLLNAINTFDTSAKPAHRGISKSTKAPEQKINAYVVKTRTEHEKLLKITAPCLIWVDALLNGKGVSFVTTGTWSGNKRMNVLEDEVTAFKNNILSLGKAENRMSTNSISNIRVLEDRDDFRKLQSDLEQAIESAGHYTSSQLSTKTKLRMQMQEIIQIVSEHAKWFTLRSYWHGKNLEFEGFATSGPNSSNRLISDAWEKFKAQRHGPPGQWNQLIEEFERHIP